MCFGALTFTGANFAAGARLLVETLEDGGVALRCIAHSLQLAVIQSVSAYPDLVDLEKQLKALVAYFSHSNQQAQLLASAAATLHLPLRKLQSDCVTRWASIHAMLKSVLVLKPALLARRLIHQTEYDKELNSFQRRLQKARSGHKKEPKEPVPSNLITQCPADGDIKWDLAQQLCSVLQLCADLSVTSEGEYYPTLTVATALALNIKTRLVLF
jgi:hypothetical protein